MSVKERVKATHASKEMGAYSNAIKCGNLIFVSGQLPVNPETGEVPTTIQEQTRQVVDNVRRILADAGVTLDNVVKTTVMLQEMSLFSEMNAVYSEEFNEPYPARTSLSVKELPNDALISLDVVAVI